MRLMLLAIFLHKSTTYPNADDVDAVNRLNYISQNDLYMSNDNALDVYRSTRSLVDSVQQMGTKDILWKILFW